MSGGPVAATAPAGPGLAAAAEPTTRPPMGRARGWLVGPALVVLALAALSILGEIVDAGPQGPTSSSYATAAQGLAAWAELLPRAGHPVSQLRQALGEAHLSPTSTLVVLDPDALTRSDGGHLSAFVRAGGRLIIGGRAPDAALASVLPDPPPWTAVARSSAAVAPAVADLAGVSRVATAGAGAWVDPGSFRVLVADASRAPIVLRRQEGRGTLYLLADTSPLQNRLLDREDNALFALDLAGGSERPVTFVESVHGFGVSRGLAAIPDRWWVALALFSVSALAWALARGRRLGPAEPPPAALGSPRRAYVQALALLLRRAGPTAELCEVMRAGILVELDARTSRYVPDRGPPDSAEREAVLRGAGVEQAQIDCVLARRSSSRYAEDLLVLGSVLARVRGGHESAS